MPLLPEGYAGQADAAGLGGHLPEPDPGTGGPAPSAWDTIKAAYQLDNTRGALEQAFTHPKPDVPNVPNYDPLAHIPEGYELHAEKFALAKSPEEMEWLKGRIDAEQAARSTISRICPGMAAK